MVRSPADAAGYLGMSAYHLRLVEYDREVESYRQALRRDPVNTEAWIDLGSLFQLMDRIEEAKPFRGL